MALRAVIVKHGDADSPNAEAEFYLFDTVNYQVSLTVSFMKWIRTSGMEYRYGGNSNISEGTSHDLE